MTASLFRYVALGDSTGIGVGSNDDGGYPERLYQRLKAGGFNVGIKNLAQSGATSTDLIRTQLNKAVELRPALITLGIGGNDLWKMVPMGTFEMNMKMIGNALAKTGAQVVVSNVIDLSRAPIAEMIDALLRVPRAMFIQRMAQLNAVVNALGSRPNFKVVDLFGVMGREKDVSPLFGPDGFHPSSLGYDRWAEELWPHVEAAARAAPEAAASAGPA